MMLMNITAFTFLTVSAQKARRQRRMTRVKLDLRSPRSQLIASDAPERRQRSSSDVAVYEGNSQDEEHVWYQRQRTRYITKTNGELHTADELLEMDKRLAEATHANQVIGKSGWAYCKVIVRQPAHGKDTVGQVFLAEPEMAIEKINFDLSSKATLFHDLSVDMRIMFEEFSKLITRERIIRDEREIAYNKLYNSIYYNAQAPKYKEMKKLMDDGERTDIPQSVIEFIDIFVKFRETKERMIQGKNIIPDYREYEEYLRLRNEERPDKRTAIESLGYINLPAKNYQVQNRNGVPRTNEFFELFDDAARVLPVFKKRMTGIEAQISQLGLKMNKELSGRKEFKIAVAGLKRKERAFYKYLYKYGQDASQLTDIVRCSIVLTDMKLPNGKWAIVEIVKILNQQFNIVRLKDKIQFPLENEYSDMLFNINLDGHICEVQIHVKELYDTKSAIAHKTYKRQRHFGPAMDAMIKKLNVDA